MQQTSLESYTELRPGLGGRQQVIYDAFKTFGPATDMEIVRSLGFPDANFVRPRRNELVKSNLIEEKYKRKCNVTSRTAIVWGTK